MTDAARGRDADPGTEARLGFLMSRAAHGTDPAAARLVETHMSWVVVAGERVLKMKKPVRYPFLDFSTPQLREHNCREELRLNRRLAPQVYLGLLALQWHEGRFALLREDRLPAPGITIDWLVLMRRLPDERMLDHVIAAGALHPADIAAKTKVLEYIGIMMLCVTWRIDRDKFQIADGNLFRILRDPEQTLLNRQEFTPKSLHPISVNACGTGNQLFRIQ